ncbi:MAG: GNAT family N-acetyltransferase [Candidatus Sifarchaeia archaeon]
MYFGKQVHLRRIEPDDLDNVMKNWNNLEMRQYLGHALPFSRAREREILDELSKQDPWKDGYMLLVIEDKNSQEFLGSVSLMNISKQNSNAELAIAIYDPKNFGKGYGTDATKVMLWFGFNILGLESVFLHTFTENERAQRAFKSAGFKEGGVRRRGVFNLGEFHDLVVMDIVKEEFFERYPPGVTVEDAK